MSAGYHQRMPRDQLTVVIAAYNEADSLPLLQPRLAAVLDDLAGDARVDGRAGGIVLHGHGGF